MSAYDVSNKFIKFRPYRLFTGVKHAYKQVKREKYGLSDYYINIINLTNNIVLLVSFIRLIWKKSLFYWNLNISMFNYFINSFYW